MPVTKLKEFLDKNKIKYVSIRHSTAYTAQEIAASAHVKGRNMAKTVIVKIDGKIAMAVLPAKYQIDLESLKKSCGATSVQLAREEEFSHLFVLFWMHEVSEAARSNMKIHPRGRKDIPLQGVFATRTQHRPNPIGLTLVELLKVNGRVLTVRGLDAYDGTPIIDIKPFDSWDIVENSRVPVIL